MKELAKYGSTKEDRGRDENSFISHCPEELGFSKSQGRNYGFNEDGTNRSNCSREANNRATQQSNGDSGKILERLEFIKNDYLLYLEQNQRHLEDRLKESREREKAFRDAIQELEQEIHELITRNNSSD